MSHDGFELPESGFTFWNVGTGDSTVVSINDEHVVLVDIRHLESAEDDDDPRIPIIDYLVDNLPRRDGVPYLATFVLTHPDEDHCQGFAELIKRVHVGELWFAPRVLDEYDDDLCDDAQAFVDEVHRRIAAIAAEGLKSGNRLRIIGYADVLDEPPYDKIPQDLVTVPGSTVSVVTATMLLVPSRRSSTPHSKRMRRPNETIRAWECVSPSTTGPTDCRRCYSAT